MERTVFLRAFEKEDISKLHKWLNDPVSIQMTGRTPQAFETTVAHVDGKLKNGDLLMAVEDEKNITIGWVFLQNIDYHHGRASIGILLSPEGRGHGYGKAAMRQMLEIGFNQLRLHKIYLTTRGFNDRAIRLYRNLGFVVEGHLREHAFVNGDYYETLFMGLLVSEWRTATD